HVALSMVGFASALAPTEAEIQEFTFHEAAFYGNLFISPNQKFVCVSSAYIDQSTREAVWPGRLCATGGCTSMHLVGACGGSVTRTQGQPALAPSGRCGVLATVDEVADHYRFCDDGVGTRWNNPITTWLRPGTASQPIPPAATTTTDSSSGLSAGY